MRRLQEELTSPGRGGGVVDPYGGFAGIYDRVMGDAVFPLIRRTFEMAVKKYHIRFQSAADIGCGTGTFLRYLRSFGVPVFGIDRSPEMLRIAAQKNRGSTVNLFRQDLRRFILPRQVDLITCNFDTLNYLLSTRDLQHAISACQGNLTNKGHFIFDSISGSQAGPGRQRVTQRIRVPGALSVWSIFWSPEQRWSKVRMHHFFEEKDGNLRKSREVHEQRWYPISMMCRLLQGAGFTVRGVHDAETFTPASKETFWVKYVARKR